MIVLDPGHGGNDTGALSNDEQTEEKDITLSTAIKVKKALEDAGVTVYLTHTTDELVQLGDICDYSEEKRQMSLSVYTQTLRNMANEATGITTYYYYGQEETLAQTIADSFTESASGFKRNLHWELSSSSRKSSTFYFNRDGLYE